jgi:hypothetical protein
MICPAVEAGEEVPTVKRIVLLLLLLALPISARAHVGSKDVFETVNAGPYSLYVTVRPPNVIPGVATVEIRSTGAAVNGLKITPLPVTGEASKHPPASDTMQQDPTDKALFTGSVWIMAGGTWQVRIEADGVGGVQTASVPVVAVPISVLKMDKSMGITLAVLGLFLVISMSGVVAASVREARLAPGLEPSPKLRRNGFLALAGSLVVMVAAVWLGGKWWKVEAADYADNIYKPAPTTVSLNGNQLDFVVRYQQPKFKPLKEVKLTYLPDHGKIMHLYAIREPEMDAAFHLHPELVGDGDFRDKLPAMPPGHYNLYGDVVRMTGFAETLLGSVDIPAGMTGTSLASEDAEATPAPLSAGMLGASYRLPDGYTMVWDKPATLRAATGYAFHFTLLEPQGKPATDMQPYLGMAGHAAFVKTDGTVFAHTHPEGSAAMADVMLADESLGGGAPMQMPVKVAPSVDFPYGFPSAGRYRIFIQMKHGSTVETGVFDAQVQ